MSGVHAQDVIASANTRPVASDDHPLHPTLKPTTGSDADEDEGNTSSEDEFIVMSASTESERRAVNVGIGVPDYASATAAVGGSSRSWTEGNLKLNRSGPRGRAGDATAFSNESRRTVSPGRPPFFARNPRGMRLASEVSLGTGLEGRPGSVYDEEGGTAGSLPHWRAAAEGSTPLERTIDAIGMGRYQYAVLVLSGLGWAADNMWLQGVAICLPRIQDEWQIQDRWIGLVSSSTFAGMMIGALAWGSYADTFGRKNAFNLTLLITAVFGMLSAFAPTFPLLCLCLFLLGTGVGGSMPTDGTIFLEALPKRSHYLLTALSVFFAAGSVLTSVAAFFIVPRNSCGGAQPCLATDNKGWRYLLATLGCLTMLFVVARLVFFTLFESPKFLVSAGKLEEARTVLQRIAAFNGQPKRVRLADVSDRQERQRRADAAAAAAVGASSRDTLSVAGRTSDAKDASTSVIHHSDEDDDNDDDNEEEAHEEGERRTLLRSNTVQDGQDSRRHTFGGHEHRHDPEWSGAGSAVSASGEPCKPDKAWPAALRWVPQSWRPSMVEGAARYAELFTPYWRRTTVLVWMIWTVFTLAYTMVNVFLPKYLESRTGNGTPHADSGRVSTDPIKRQQAMEAVMRDFLLYSFASLPGSLLGAYLIETRLGRIRSMAFSTLLLAFSLLAFAMSAAPTTVIATSCSISLFASVAYAVIYSYSPEVFKTSLRGTASGTASALSRLAGIVAPVLAGALLQVNVNLPLYLGFALFGVTVWLQLSLPFETRGRDVEAESAEAAAAADG